MTTLLAHLPVERLGWVLIHSLWQFLAIALVVRLLERSFAGRGSASVRYVAGVCGLAAMTAAPVVTWFFLPGTPPASAGPVVPGLVVERMEALRLTAAAQPVPSRAGPVSPSSEGMDPPLAENSLAATWSAGWRTLVLWLRPWLPILVTCWLVGMAFCSLRPLLGWLTLRRLGTVGVTAGGPVLEESARRMAARLCMTQAVSVLGSTLAKTPLVVGYLRPMLLVPVGMVAQLPVAELEAILAHELAHLRRHDFLVNLWQTSLETIFFYHPSVWSLSHRLRAEREHCCDDVALSVVGDPVCYGRALLHVEELCGPEPLLALGAGGSSLPGRIQRLFGQPTPPSSAAGLTAAVLLPSVALAGVLAAFAGAAPAGNDGQAEAKPSQKPEPAPVEKPVPAPAPAARSLDIVIAQHVIVWDGRIRTWDEVVTELREIRKAHGKPIHPSFRFTNGAHAAGHWDTYKAKVFELYKELFEPAGVSFGSISPRAGPRYDVLRKAEDLVVTPKSLRSGVVVEKGQPKAGVLVVLVPEEGMMPVVLKPDLTLRDPHDEVWAVTGPDGRFTLPVQPVHALDKLTEPPTYALAAISPTRYGRARVPAEGEQATIDLQPLARVELTPVEGKPQRIDLSFRGGLPDKSPGFSIYEIELRDKPLPLDLPPGKVTIQRAFRHQDGSSRSYPAATLRIGPGAGQQVELPNVTEEEAERRWTEESIRPKRDAHKPEGR
jgi:beta-lactamase regulating signal transducer with metallopeptidase domain